MGTNSFDVNDGTTSTNGGYVNYSTRTYVETWNWRANGGTTSTNDDESIQSTVQANTTGLDLVL